MIRIVIVGRKNRYSEFIVFPNVIAFDKMHEIVQPEAQSCVRFLRDVPIALWLAVNRYSRRLVRHEDYHCRRNL